MSKPPSWGDKADVVLATLFVRGQPHPTEREIFDAYPFGSREYYPYKAWLRRVKAWKVAFAKGAFVPREGAAPKAKRPVAGDTETGTLL